MERETIEKEEFLALLEGKGEEGCLRTRRGGDQGPSYRPGRRPTPPERAPEREAPRPASAPRPSRAGHRGDDRGSELARDMTVWWPHAAHPGSVRMHATPRDRRMRRSPPRPRNIPAVAFAHGVRAPPTGAGGGAPAGRCRPPRRRRTPDGNPQRHAGLVLGRRALHVRGGGDRARSRPRRAGRGAPRRRRGVDASRGGARPARRGATARHPRDRGPRCRAAAPRSSISIDTSKALRSHARRSPPVRSIVNDVTAPSRRAHRWPRVGRASAAVGHAA